MTKENMQIRSQPKQLWTSDIKRIKIDLGNITHTIVFLTAFLAVWEVIVLLEVFQLSHYHHLSGLLNLFYI
jgi:hypothetical protein